MREKIKQLLDTLHFQGMALHLDLLLDQAEQAPVPTEEVLLKLLQEEHAHRQERSMAYRIRQAKLPWDWTLDTFPFERQPGVDQRQIMGLASLDFIQRAQNVVLIGSPGTGKSGIAMGLLRQALINGYRGRFYPAQDLADDLYASLADRSTSHLLRRLSALDVLLIDELGYLTLNAAQVNAFFKLLDQRYGKKTTLITTNLDYPEWYDLFQRKPLVDALLDRLRHHCITIHINGPSLRTPPKEPPFTKKTKGKAAPQ